MRTRWLLIALALVACRHTESREPAHAIDVADRDTLPPNIADQLNVAVRDSVLWSFMDTFDLDTPRSMMVQKLGTPAAVHVHTVRNEYDSTEIDTVVSVRFHSLEVVWLVPPAHGRETLLTVAVIDEHVALPLGMHLGWSRSQLTSLLGEPETAQVRGDTTSLYYTIRNEEAPNSLLFDLVGERVIRIVWFPYID